MKKLALAYFLFNVLFSDAQNPLVKMWDYRYGGYNSDAVSCFCKTIEGGFIIGGSTTSGIGADKTQANRGANDYWIVKLDSTGFLQWEKDYGGTDDDLLYSIQQTSDGGYILGGYSYSGISGDKTGACWGYYDYWIVKLDSSGIKQWDKDLGGLNVDWLYSLTQTSDGGYLVGGTSYSGIGGNKSQPSWGGYDYWIVKLDSTGGIQWDKDFGGTGDDVLRSLQETSHGGYILGGYSSSGISGDKTEPARGSVDFWMIKIDSTGNKQWDKTFGGADVDQVYSLRQTRDNGFILAGSSNSLSGGDKTQNTWGGYDYWILKTDSLGNKQWDRDFGGPNNEDEFGNVLQAYDGGFLISGSTYSQLGGDKTENNLGAEQTWIVKTDSLGNKQWDKTIFTPGHDENGLLALVNNTCLTVVNATNGSIGGYKSQSAQNNTPDYWIIKFCDSTYLQPIATSIADSFLCPGTCANFTNLSLNANFYQWFFPGAIPDTSTAVNPVNICYANSGTYDVELIASNSNGSDTLLLTNYMNVYPAPPPQAITQTGDTLFAIAGATSYQWYFNGSIINSATNYYYVALSGGDYNLVATDANGCEVEAAIFNVLANTQMGTGNEVLELFPNPVGDIVEFKNLTFEINTISIYNTLGVLELSGHDITSSRNHTEFDIHSLPPGIFWIEISGDEKNFRSEFIKQ